MKPFVQNHLFFLLILLSINLQGQEDFFGSANQFFETFVKAPNVDYAAIKAQPSTLKELVKAINNFPYENVDSKSQKAFLINAYNLLVIKGIVDQYPVASPLEISGFFEVEKFFFRGKYISLNHLEKEILFKQFPDPRLHFVLVCGAVDCPPIQAKAYFPDQLEERLEAATKSSIQNPVFIRITPKSVAVSEIFRWYLDDFGPTREYLSQYIELPAGSKLKFYPYDWTLNDIPEKNITGSLVPFRASFLLEKGQWELKVFNALYTQRSFDGFDQLNSRSTYFSVFGQFLIGLNTDLNIGLDVVYKSNVLNDQASNSPFNALAFERSRVFQTFPCDSHQGNIVLNSPCLLNPMGMDMGVDTFRQADGQVLETVSQIGLSHLGPKFKINPIKKWKNLSLQQTFYIPIQKEVDGQWISFTQLFYDQPIGNRFQLFTEGSLWTPVAPTFRNSAFLKFFFSYFPTQKWTIYTMANVPSEYGIGTKYFISPQFEIELLYTHYLPVDFFVGSVRPNTFNLGFRYRSR